jgi:hypothetical protein
VWGRLGKEGRPLKASREVIPRRWIRLDELATEVCNMRHIGGLRRSLGRRVGRGCRATLDRESEAPRVPRHDLNRQCAQSVIQAADELIRRLQGTAAEKLRPLAGLQGGKREGYSKAGEMWTTLVAA